MKLIKTGVTIGMALAFLTGFALGADTKSGDKPAAKLTCCQEAAAAKKECRHKCCVAAHKEGKSCTKCNPNKEDLKPKKDDKKATAKAS
jgi:hypothetical protein